MPRCKRRLADAPDAIRRHRSPLYAEMLDWDPIRIVVATARQVTNSSERKVVRDVQYRSEKYVVKAAI